MSDEYVDLVLDTSAVLAFAEGNLDVGETIAEAANEGAFTALPVLCLAEACAAGADLTMVQTLVRNPRTVLIADDPAEWQSLVEMRGLVEALAEASAVLAAIDYGAHVLTADPGLYARIDDGGPVIPF